MRWWRSPAGPDNSRRRLTAAARRPPGAGIQVAKKIRRQRNPKHSSDAVKVLQRVWAASGGQCGRYRAASKAHDQIKGKSTTKASPLLRSSVKIRKATDEVEAAPGFRRRHRHGLRADPQRRVRPHPHPHRCAYRPGLHPHRPEQRPHPHPHRTNRGPGRPAGSQNPEGA